MTRKQFIENVEKQGTMRVTDYYTQNKFVGEKKDYTCHFGIVIDYEADEDDFYRLAYKFHTMKEVGLTDPLSFEDVHAKLVHMMTLDGYCKA